ncbi:MAG: IS200/IS605 family accessory protein TnpB-related protein [Solobacterium sp.]|nr:IS200/IS605 family accessory protein TnpB-related protein [Solobacterium sp.]
MTKAFKSRHVHLSEEDLDRIKNDIELFNRIKHKAAASLLREEDAYVPGIDRRKKENRNLIQSESLHVRLKKEFGVSDYFVNSAVNEAKASIQSVKELQKQNEDNLKFQIRDIKKKIASTEKRLNGLKTHKQSIVRYSQGKGKVKNTTWEQVKEDGTVTVQFGKKITIYSCLYDYEVKYLDPKIKQLKSKLRFLKNRLCRLEHRLAKTKEIHICFGTKKLFRAQETIYTDHSIWKRKWNLSRNHRMQISGRKDAKSGNFLFGYDPGRHELSYRSADGEVIRFKCEFPYGQEQIDRVIKDNLSRNNRTAVCFAIELTGGSVLITCMVTPPAEQKYGFLKDGAVSIDTNVDRIALSVLDGNGNQLERKVIPFNIAGKTSEQAEHILSHTLEQVYQICRQTGKLLVMEDLDIKQKLSKYGSSKRNRILSGFASSKITQLVEGKSDKYQIELMKVSPSYTSQIGKIKFMKSHGQSVHEAASMVIGRRALGITEHVPSWIYRTLSSKEKALPVEKQWSAAYKITKDITPSEMYIS